MCNIRPKLQACFDLIETAIFLPVAESYTALEKWCNITGCGPSHRPKCSTGKMMPQFSIAVNQLQTG